MAGEECGEYEHPARDLHQVEHGTGRLPQEQEAALPDGGLVWNEEQVEDDTQAVAHDHDDQTGEDEHR